METTISTIATALAILAAVCYLIYCDYKRRKGDPAADLAEVQNLKDVLISAAFGIVTRCEREHGAGTGALKLSEAVESLLSHIPDHLRGQFTAQVLTDLVEDALSAAKIEWAKNPALLNTGENMNAVGFKLDSDYDSEEL